MDDTKLDWRQLSALSFAALGVVYGDIGTSPLYSIRVSMLHLGMSNANLFGILSLVFWSLILIISFKYISIIMCADNDGEGGIMALSALLKRKLLTDTPWLLFLTIIGVGLIIGDGMLTPAISVLSAVEGLEAFSPEFARFVIPITLIILILLFSLQKAGSGKIGILFGPIILVWFATIAILGFMQIMQHPAILKAINPYYAYHFFTEQKIHAFIALGGVFLVVTGGEALYADIGHFGKKSIRLAWFTIVLPALLINYFGQGAYLLLHPEAIANPFYSLAPRWFLPILIVLATAATIIASQAIITAVFSILKQAILLNIIPRFKIVQTSTSEKGQVYLPTINLFIALGTCALVIVFQSSIHLGSAYGIAVNLYMLITTLLVTRIAYSYWRWNYLQLAIFPLFLIIDLAYLSGNLYKFIEGGWIPLLIALIAMIIMYTWQKGMHQLHRLHHHETASSHSILEELNQKKIRRLPGTALFLTDPYDELGTRLLHHLSLNRILAKTAIFLSVHIQNKPHVPLRDKFEIIKKAEGFYLLNINCGFAEHTHLPKLLATLTETMVLPFELNLAEMAFFIEIIAIEITSRKTGSLWLWQKFLFSFMLRNAVPDIQYYSLPYNKTIAIGAYYRL